MKRGIFLVANLKSQELTENLIYSIRASGCVLPIRLIHFGGLEIQSKYVLSQVELLRYSDFPEDAKNFVYKLRSVLTDCPLGFLYRFLAFFSDWDEFIYSDNDIVALCNWEALFDQLQGYDLLHSDKEYTTEGKFNYKCPESVKTVFGDSALASAFTAGHIVLTNNKMMVEDITKAIEWFKKNPDIPKKHDQSLLHIASLLGNWKMINLCKPPHNWLSSWAGDYKNSLELIHQIQYNNSNISHLHYSGSTPKGDLAIQDLLLSNNKDRERLMKLCFVILKSFLGYKRLSMNTKKIQKLLKKKINNLFF